MTKKKILITAVVSVLVLLIAGSGGYLLFKHLHMQNYVKEKEFYEMFLDVFYTKA